MSNNAYMLNRAAEKPWFPLVAAATDAAGLALAWSASLQLRLLLNPVIGREFTPANIGYHAIPLPQVMLAWALTALALGLYKRQRSGTLGEKLTGVLNCIVLFCSLIVLYTFFWAVHGTDLSRSFILLFGLVSLCCLLALRYALIIALVLTGEKLIRDERILVAGEGDCARQVVENISAETGSRAVVVGFVVPEAAASAGAQPVYHSMTKLAEVINRERVDRIIIANGSLSSSDFDECIRVSRKMGVVASHALITSHNGIRYDIKTQYGMPLVDMRPPSFSRIQELVKLCFDAFFSALLLILVSPVMLVCAVMIRLTSDGPVFYRSPRVGRGGRYFTLLKFRSMYTKSVDRQALMSANEKSGHLFKIRKDPRVTPVGRFLRRTSFDELPQLINVVLGEMSLVGPRPLPIEDLDPDGQSRQFTDWAQLRSSVRPGISGLWQVKGRSDLSFGEMIELDTEYIRNWSLSLDLRILLVTPIAVITGSGAY